MVYFSHYELIKIDHNALFSFLIWSNCISLTSPVLGKYNAPTIDYFPTNELTNVLMFDHVNLK